MPGKKYDSDSESGNFDDDEDSLDAQAAKPRTSVVSRDDGYDTDTEDDAGGATHGKGFFGKAMDIGSKGINAAAKSQVTRMAKDKL